MKKPFLFTNCLIISMLLANEIGCSPGSKKLQKSFDEIFGEGWDKAAQKRDKADQKIKKAEQKCDAILEDGLKRDQQNVNGPKRCGKTTKILLSSSGKNNDCLNHHQINAEEPTIDQNGLGNGDENENDQQKKEIVIKFREIKEKIKQKKEKYSPNEWSRIECVIARKLGTTRKHVYKWITEFEIGKRKMYNSDQQKREIVIRFQEIKKEIKQKGRKYSKNEWGKIDRLVANKLGTNDRRIYKWAKAIGMGQRNDPKKFTEKQKDEIVKKFIEMTNKFKQKGKHSHKEREQKYAEIAKKLGIGYITIKKWKKAFGMSREQNIYTDEEKHGIMRQYWEMKRTHPGISEEKIAKALKIVKSNLYRWKAQLRDE